jgi:hypothetical protein
LRSVRSCTGAPGGEGDAGNLEVLAGIAAPELFLVDAMAAFDLAVLLRTLRADVAHPHAQLLAGQVDDERELGPVVDLELANLNRERRCELAEGNARLE